MKYKLNSPAVDVLALGSLHRQVVGSYGMDCILLRKFVTTSAAHKGLSHWGRVTHICVGNLTIIGPDNGLSPGRRQAIIWTNVGILLIGPWGTNFSDILIRIHTFSWKKIHLKMSSAKWRPFCLGLNVLTIPVSVRLIIKTVLYS